MRSSSASKRTSTRPCGTQRTIYPSRNGYASLLRLSRHTVACRHITCCHTPSHAVACSRMLSHAVACCHALSRHVLSHAYMRTCVQKCVQYMHTCIHACLLACVRTQYHAFICLHTCIDSNCCTWLIDECGEGGDHVVWYSMFYMTCQCNTLSARRLATKTECRTDHAHTWVCAECYMHA